MITAIKERNKRITKAVNKLDFLLKTLSCDACKKIMSEKVYFCKISKGRHNFCEDCLIQGNVCPICPETGRCRNLYLEQLFLRTLNESTTDIINSGIVWCKYGNNGCKENRVAASLEDHERICLHQTTKCTFCPWVGTYKQIHKHCVEAHEDITVENGDLFENDIQHQLFLVKGQVFVFIRKYTSRDAMGFSVHHVTPSGRTNCQYELRIIKKTAGLMEVDTYEGNCRASSMEELRNDMYLEATLEENLIRYLHKKRKQNGRYAQVISANLIVFPVSG